MTTQRIDIEIQDRVAKSIRTELTSIGAAARSTFASIKELKTQLAGLSAATSRMSAQNIKAALDAERLAQAQYKTALAKQKLATETAKTTAAQTKAAQAYLSEETALNRAVAAEQRAATATVNLARSKDAAALASSGVSQAYLAEETALNRAVLAEQRVAASTASSAAARQHAASSQQRAAQPAERAYNFGGGSSYIRDLGENAKISAQHMANLSFQINDVFVSLASGQNPLTVFIQQGAQVGQIATQAGVGLGTLATAGLTWLGILKTTTGATEASALAVARSRAINIQTAVNTVAANIAAAETEIALAVAQAQVATTAQASAAAAARLAAANTALAESNAAAAVTARAQATAQAQLASAQSAATASTTTRLTALGRASVVGAVASLALAAALGSLTGAINETVSAGDLTEGLNLTAKEMRNLENVTVTWGDTAKAVFQVVGRAIWDKVGGAVTTAWNWMKEWMSWIAQGAKTAVNYLIGSFVGAYRLITTTWRQFPLVLGDLFVSGVNVAIRAINFLITAAINGVNGLIARANAVLPEAFQISPIAAVQIASVENQWSGAMARMGDKARTVMRDALDTDYVGNAFDAIRDQAVANARARIRAQAEEAGYLDPKNERKTGKTENEAEKRAEALDKVNRELNAQLELTRLYGPALERETRFLAIRNALLDKKIALSAPEEKSIRERILLIQEGERVQAQLNRIEEDALGPQRQYDANLQAIAIALQSNIITEAEAARQRNLAKTALEDATAPLRSYHEELRRGKEDLAHYGQALADIQRARELLDRDVAAGVTTRDKSSANDYLGQASEERKRQQLNAAFAEIDPRTRENPGSSSFILDHAREMYAELARLREEDLISEQEAAERKKNLDRAHLDARLEHTSSILGKVSQLQNSKNKELAALGKAAAIAQATIDGYRAVQAALVGPPGPPWSYAIAGVTAAMTAANIAKIAGVGFMSGGYTGAGANNEVAGSVHRNEYVFDAAATRRIGVPALEALRRGTLAQPPANDNRRNGSPVIIRPMPGVFVEERRTSDGEIELIAKRVVAREAPRVVAQDIKSNPNSQTAKALGGAYGLRRADR